VILERCRGIDENIVENPRKIKPLGSKFLRFRVFGISEASVNFRGSGHPRLALWTAHDVEQKNISFTGSGTAVRFGFRLKRARLSR
jgi:hypothetical protein